MKTNLWPNWTVVCLSVLTALGTARTLAEPVATVANQETKNEKTYTGTVVSVDPKERVLVVKGWLRKKNFNLGEDCAFTLVDKNATGAADVRAGQRVTVGYQNADGVLIANRVEQQPLRYEGTVKAIDPQAHTLTLHLRAVNKEFRIADDCQVLLRNNRAGTFADVQPGHHVTVLYEIPNEEPTVRQIAQTSATFEGALTAIDLTERTLKAKAAFGSKKFNVANDCAIVLAGKPDAQLKDLKPNDRLTFSFDEVNGVNVVNRIATAGSSNEATTAQARVR